jgi:hypothetical protein
MFMEFNILLDILRETLSMLPQVGHPAVATLPQPLYSGRSK